MLAVSQGWKEAHTNMLLPETFIEINYNISEPGLQEDAQFSITDATSFSELPMSMDEGDKHSRLEWNAWGLDGSFSAVEGSPSFPGYVTETLSDASALFPALPTVEVRFDSVRTALIPGITICWSNTFDEWASSFRITVYNGANVVTQTLVEHNTQVLSPVWLEFSQFDRVQIEVLEWCLPHRRSRTMYVFIGITATYTKQDLLGFTHTKDVDLLSAALSKSEITFNLDNSQDIWDPTNPTGSERYLMERQKVTLRYGMLVDGRTEWIDAGTFWLSEWNTPSNGIEASFTARDAIQFMDDLYTGPKSGNLHALAISALNQVNLDGEPLQYVIHDSLQAIPTDFSSFEGDYTVSELLQMIAHAGCCVFYCDTAGVVHIEPRADHLTDYEINAHVSYTYPEISLSKPLKAVRVDYGEVSHTVSVAAAGETQTVSNELIQRQEDAVCVANSAIAVLKNRKTISGEYRADPRVEPMDIITVHNKYSSSKVAITSLSFQTSGGALRGQYTGRVIDDG